MYLIIWEYHVAKEKVKDFEKSYASDGAWAALFEKGRGYLGTELLRNENNKHRFLTVDRWESIDEYETFMLRYKKEYIALDKLCEHMTEKESLVGKWTIFSS